MTERVDLRSRGKARTGNFLEDFFVGKNFKHATPRTLCDGDQSLYIGLTGSREPLGSALPLARSVGLRDRPLDDFLVFNVAFGKTVQDISLNAVANLGYADVRFLQPVFSGDTLSAESEVIGVKENSSGDRGVVYVRSTARNQRSEVVLTWIRWVMVPKRDPKNPKRVDHVPQLPAIVDWKTITLPGYGALRELIGECTGSPDYWEDYVVGERIDHASAMTVNDSDHSIATRLYQNTALVHFDGYRMAGSHAGARLVYGGHVISLCKAMAYDGLENAVATVAINGGAHVAATFAGDTLCCATIVLDKVETANPDVGLLRLRLVGAKNLESSRRISFPVAAAGKRGPTYDPGTVLDLDYFVAMAKRPSN